EGLQLELVEPGENRGHGLVEVGEHALVVVARKLDVPKLLPVESGGEQLHPAAEGDLLVLVSPEREEWTRQVGDQGIWRQFREFTVESKRRPRVEVGIDIRPGFGIALRLIDPALGVRVE